MLHCKAAKLAILTAVCLVEVGVRRAAITLFVLPGTILPSSADVLFQSIPDLSVNTCDNACSTCSFVNVQVFDSFSLSSAAAISAIEFNVVTSYFYPGVGTYYQFPSYVNLSIWTAVRHAPR
jgi:hypothetical protein